MKRLMRYKIKSGRVWEKRDVMIDVSLDPTEGKPRPRGKRRGKSMAAQIERNMREAIRRLARILNCNFRGGDVFVTLKYNDRRLPENREEAAKLAKKFLRRVGAAYRAEMGRKLRYVLVTADVSSKTGLPCRLHHHLVLPGVSWELCRKFWPDDQMSYRVLDNGGDYSAVAAYMVRNTGYRRGQRSWSTSQGMERPVFYPPEPVKELGSFRVPRDGVVAERELREDEESGFRGAYIRYVVPEGEFPDATTRAVQTTRAIPIAALPLGEASVERAAPGKKRRGDPVSSHEGGWWGCVNSSHCQA